MAAPVNDSYSCISGGSVYAGRRNLPIWVPARNTVATLTEVNTFQSVNPGRSPANGWSFNSSGALIGGDSYIFAGTIDAFSGGVYNPYYGAKGCIVFCGGGHSVSNWCGIAIFDIATLTYSIIQGGSTNCYPVTVANGEYADGSPVAVHSYDLLTIIGPEAGYPQGALVLPFINGGTVEANVSSSAAHLFDFANPSSGWMRVAENNAGIIATDASCAAYDNDLNRVWWIRAGNNLSTLPFYDISTGAQSVVNLINKIPATYTNSLSLRYDSSRHLLIHPNGSLDGATRRIYYMDTSGATNGFVQATLSTAFPAPIGGLGFSFDKILDGSYLCNVQGRIFRMIIPSVLTDVWEVTEVAYLGTTLNTSPIHGKRWSYIPSIESFIWKSASTTAHQIYRV